MSASKIVIFMFAGRKENMEVQWPYLQTLMARYPQLEVHLWDLTRKASDQKYLHELAGDPLWSTQVYIFDQFHTGHPIRCRYPNGATRRRGFPPCLCMMHKPPYEKPYQWYAQTAGYEDAVFVKIDDDVLFLETDRLDDLIDPLEDHPNRIISANVINNVVAAKYSPDALALANKFEVGDPENWDNDNRWWWLHTNPEFAIVCHSNFLNDWENQTDTEQPEYVRTRPGEAISINCIAFKFATMRRLAAAFKHSQRLGDEGVVDQCLPWICKTFHAAHLTFGPQDKEMTTVELDSLRQQYTELAKEYL